MQNRYGVTEKLWGSLPEDKRFLWKITCWSVAFLASLTIEKIGVRFLDWMLTGLTTLTAMLIIESQRNLRRYKSPRLRKRLIRATLFLGTSSVALLGTAFFLSVGYIFSQAMFKEYLSTNDAFGPNGVLTVAIISIAVAAGLFRSFRELQLAEIFYRLPLFWLRRLLVVREFTASSFPEFAFFEFVVIFVSYIYVSSVAQIVKTIISAAEL